MLAITAIACPSYSAPLADPSLKSLLLASSALQWVYLEIKFIR